MAYTALA